MISKKKWLKKSKIYVILDKNTGKDPIKIFKKIKNKRIDIIQLRDKNSSKIKILQQALRIKNLVDKKKIIFIINDFVDIAKMVDADGVHLGQKDLSINEAGKTLGCHKIIGVSCHNLRQLIAAQKKGADYMAIGPVFPTTLKPRIKPIGLNILNKITQKNFSKPIFAVGGINASNLNKILATGIRRIALSGAICKSKNPAGVIRELNKLLRQN